MLLLVAVVASVLLALVDYLVTGSYYLLIGLVVFWLAARLVLAKFAPRIRGWERATKAPTPS